MTTPAAAPTAMSTGSGTLNRHATTRAVAPITRVGTSMMARLARTKHAGAERLSQAGGACATIATKPQVTKSQTISDSVHAVTTAITAKISHCSLSLAMVSFASL